MTVALTLPHRDMLPHSRCSLRGLNPRPMAHKTIALTTELRELESQKRKVHLDATPVIKSPWPNGQGVGLLIRRLWARVPQGMSLTTSQCCPLDFARALYMRSREASRRLGYTWPCAGTSRACGLMDKALVFGTKDCRFESCQAQYIPHPDTTLHVLPYRAPRPSSLWTLLEDIGGCAGGQR